MSSSTQYLDLIVISSAFLCKKIHEAKPCYIHTKISLHNRILNLCMPSYILFISPYKIGHYFSVHIIIVIN
jgi:hypothetical protein